MEIPSLILPSPIQDLIPFIDELPVYIPREFLFISDKVPSQIGQVNPRRPQWAGTIVPESSLLSPDLNPMNGWTIYKRSGAQMPQSNEHLKNLLEVCWPSMVTKFVKTNFCSIRKSTEHIGEK